MAAGEIALSSPRGRWVLLATVLASSVALLDTTVVNIALPTLGRELDVGFSGLQWTVNGYTLTLAALILLGGSLGDRFGRRRVFVIGSIWFAVASLLCGLAPRIEVLVAARMLQGVGAALLTPGSLALISASFRPQDRARAIGAWSGLGGLASAAGPFLGGILVPISWRLVFLINLPVCVVVVLVAARHVPESRDAEMAPQLDLPGVLLGAAGLAALTYTLTGLGSPGSRLVLVATGVVALACLVGFVVVERRSAHPMLPTELFSSRQFTAANLVTFVVYAALSGVLFLLVLHLQVVGGLSPLAAGTSLLPVTACLVLLSSRSGALAARIGPRRSMSAGPVLLAAGTLLLLRIGVHPSYVVDVLPAVTVFGLGLAATVAPLTVTVLAAAPVRNAGVASGINNAVARTAGLVAVAALPLAAGLTGADYRNPAAFAHGFHIAVYVCAALLLLGGATAAVLVSDRERL